MRKLKGGGEDVVLWENDYDMKVQSDQVRLRGGYDHGDNCFFGRLYQV